MRATPLPPSTRTGRQLDPSVRSLEITLFAHDDRTASSMGRDTTSRRSYRHNSMISSIIPIAPSVEFSYLEREDEEERHVDRVPRFHQRVRVVIEAPREVRALVRLEADRDRVRHDRQADQHVEHLVLRTDGRPTDRPTDHTDATTTTRRRRRRATADRPTDPTTDATTTRREGEPRRRRGRAVVVAPSWSCRRGRRCGRRAVVARAGGRASEREGVGKGARKISRERERARARARGALPPDDRPRRQTTPTQTSHAIARGRDGAPFAKERAAPPPSPRSPSPPRARRAAAPPPRPLPPPRNRASMCLARATSDRPRAAGRSGCGTRAPCPRPCSARAPSTGGAGSCATRRATRRYPQSSRCRPSPRRR